MFHITVEKWMAVTTPLKKSPNMIEWMAQTDPPREASKV